MPRVTVETIINLPKTQKISILCAIIVSIVGSYIYSIYLPRNELLSGKRTELAKLQVKLEEQKKIVADLPRFEKEVAHLEAQFKEALMLLPNSREIPSLLTNISNLAQDCGLEILLFQPKPEIQESFYAEIPVEMKTLGKYHDLGIFFDRVSKLPRIVNITDISMNRMKGKDELSGKLNAAFKAVTYKFIEAKPDSGKRKKGKGKR